MNDKKEKLSFENLIKILKKRYKVILCVTMACSILSAILVLFFIKPTYEAKLSVIIGNSLNADGSKLQYNDLILYQKLVKTYGSIAKTTVVAEKTIEKLNLKITADELQRNITATAQQDTQILEIKVKAKSPEEAVNIINTLSKIFIEEAKSIYSSDNVKIIDKVKYPDKPISPSRKMFVGIAFFIGLILSGIVVLIMEYLDNTIKTEEDVKEYMNLHVIGCIPKQVEVVDRFDVTTIENFSSTVEAFRTLRTNIDFLSLGNKVKTIMVTSGRAGEGKTTTAYILAAVMALSGKKILLIDCDLRKPKIHKVFNFYNNMGLSNILAINVSFKDAVQKTDLENLYVLTSGIKPPNPTELLGSSNMKDLLSLLREEYEYIILDTPPVGIVTDAQVVSQLADGCILVVASGEAIREETVKAKSLLEYVNAKILGVCLNKINESSEYYYGDYFETNNNKSTIKDRVFNLLKLKK